MSEMEQERMRITVDIKAHVTPTNKLCLPIGYFTVQLFCVQCNETECKDIRTDPHNIGAEPQQS